MPSKVMAGGTDRIDPGPGINTLYRFHSNFVIDITVVR
jgi:hypothetical protein